MPASTGKSTLSKPQLGNTARIRPDGSRRVGYANAVAKGADLSRVGVLSDRELAWICRLAEEDSTSVEGSRKAEEERRLELSKARVSRWKDTTEARHEDFVRRRAAEKEEEERRRITLDELYAQQEEEVRRARVAQLELKNLREDPRGRNVKSSLMLHEAIKKREEQIAFKRECEAREKVDGARELEEMRRQHWGEGAEEARKRMEAKQRDAEDANAHLEAMLFQIEKRKEERAEEKSTRVFVDAEAADERMENEAEIAERLQREREIGLYNKAHAREAVTKAQRLKERITQGVAEARDQEAADEDQRKRKAALLEQQRVKMERFEKRKQAALETFLAQTAEESPKYRTQDRFEQKQDAFFLRMSMDDVTRVADSRERNRKCCEGDPSQGHRKAEATASGCLDAEEERALQTEAALLPEKVRAEEAAEKARQLEEALRIEKIQRLQSQEKQENKRLEIEARREEARLQKAEMEEDDARYLAYITSQIPADMSPVLREKAIRMQ